MDTSGSSLLPEINAVYIKEEPQNDEDVFVKEEPINNDQIKFKEEAQFEDQDIQPCYSQSTSAFSDDKVKCTPNLSGMQTIASSASCKPYIFGTVADKPGLFNKVPSNSFDSTTLRPSKLEQPITSSYSSDSDENEFDDDYFLDPVFVRLLDTIEPQSEEENYQEKEDEPILVEINSIEFESGQLQSPQKSPTKAFWKKVNKQKSCYSTPAFQDIPVPDASISSPLSYFKQFFTDELLEEMCCQTNQYAMQKDPTKPLQVTKLELEQWIGICMQMSITKIDKTRVHWSSYALSDKISSIMSHERWKAIKNSLHLGDNSKLDPTTDKLAKVRLLVDHLREKFQNLPKEEHLCVDEQSVPFKGSSMKQYLHKKPINWGYTIFVLVGSSGLVYDFISYVDETSPVDRPGTPDLDGNENAVLHLLECIPEEKYFKVYLDNRFTSVKLVEHLASRKIMACGIVHERKLQGLTFKSDKQLQKLGRGSFDEHEMQESETTITALKWYDSQAVSFLSSFLNSYPVKKCTRYDKKRNKYVEVSLPNIVSEYNQHMGGAKIHDQFMAYYRTNFRSKDYYLRIVFHMIDMAVANSCLLLRSAEMSRKMPSHRLTSLCEFKLKLSNALMYVNKEITKKRCCLPSETVQFEYTKKKKMGHATKPIPEENIRKDGVGHLPSLAGRRGTCKYPKCSGRVHMFCMKCQVHLCCVKTRNCFAAFHQE
ncbi:piggyBac transposable element-derived protein 2 isoform X2 [Hyalella azteca]|uniref:PiggyBac transposable element-derived protein 2 isoform X2 n=1 Tax=Hyalella azteca TaxID=294128 RepID=A0A8B7NGG3_HYAAZ|nr:piggyBac transposable element-derived protein 2 isoform X2 [Hyalella azteca]